MRKLTTSLLLTICLGALLWTSPHASAARADATSSGVIAGALVNGAHNDAPLPGVSVTLRVYHGNGQPQDLTSAVTDAAGHFRFTSLDTSSGLSYDVYAAYQNGAFTSPVVTFSSGATQHVTLSVYDTTSNDANLRVSLATILFSPPNQQGGYIPVGEYVTFENSGSTAYVPAQGPASGMPAGLLRFALPAGATNLTLGAGFSASQQVTQVSTGFAATATVPPGKSQFAFAFDIPYTSTSYSFSYKAEYATDQIAVLMPMGVAVSAGDYTTEPPVTANGTHYQLLTRGALVRDQASALTLSQLPSPGERQYLDFRVLVGVGVVFALMLALLLTLYLRRGALSVVFGLVPAAAPRPQSRRRSGRPSALGGVSDRSERKRLLRELLTLESSRKAGKLDDQAFQRRSAEVRAQLRDLIALSERAAASPAGTAEIPPAQATRSADTEDHDAVAGNSRPAKQNQGRVVTGGKR